MFEIAVEHVFSASHQVLLPGGVFESLHGHNWHVTCRIRAERLDACGFVCDFHVVQAALAAIIAPWNSRHLNDATAFADWPVSAEGVAWKIGESLRTQLDGHIGDARLHSVSVTEAPGCTATWLAEERRMNHSPR